MKHPRRSASSTRPPGPKTGYGHPRCYGRDLLDCSTKISGEHYVSDVILQQMGGTADVSGLAWMDGGSIGLPAKALAANILCERHNGALSPLDAEAGRLFEALRDFDVALGDHAPPTTSSRVVINGPDIQRWMLKCLLGAVYSGNLTVATLNEPARCVRVLFGEATWPPGWGLYLSPKPSEHAFSGVALMTLIDDDGGTIRAFVANIAGLRLLLSLGVARGDGLYHRTAGARFKHAARPAVKTLALAWSTEPASDFMTFTRSEPYGGEPVEHF